MHHSCHFVHQRYRLCRHRQRQYDHTGDMVSAHTDHHLVMEVAELAICKLLQSNQILPCIQYSGCQLTRHWCVGYCRDMADIQRNILQ